MKLQNCLLCYFSKDDIIEYADKDDEYYVITDN